MIPAQGAHGWAKEETPLKNLSSVGKSRLPQNNFPKLTPLGLTMLNQIHWVQITIKEKDKQSVVEQWTVKFPAIICLKGPNISGILMG